MQRKKAVGWLLAMGVILALATLGLVYTNWSQKLTINGNVNTGSLNVNWEVECAGLDPNVGCTVDNEVGKKDIGECTIDQSGSKKIDIVITNGYPGYVCHFWTNITNKGSLDVVIANTPTFNAAWLDVDQVTTTFVPGDWTPAAGSLSKGDCKNPQLPGGGTIDFCDWEITVLKGAPQDTKIPFSIQITATLVNTN